MSELNIYQRINKVMQAVKYVQKDKQVSGGGQNYKAVTHDQVVSVARHELVKAGIVIYPEQLTSKLLQERDLSREIKMHLYSGDYAIHFVNMDKPEDRVTVCINAHAADNGDKAPGKAVTYATKTAILKVLSLETGDDDESRAKDQDTITDDQAKEIQQLIEEAGQTVKAFCDSAQIDELTELQVHRFKPAKAHLRRVAAKAQQEAAE